MRTKVILTFCLALLLFDAGGQSMVSSVWVADLGDGTYKNPVLHADYSDPDVCRVGDDFYMVSSSFNSVPGLPILHSKDLVNWTLIGHALKKLVPEDYYANVRHGGGVWAPSIRFHENEFWIYYPDPDFGIYLVKSKSATGPWSEPVLVEGGKGLIDSCPLWDDDGQAYLVHAYAGSRAGIKSILVVKKLNSDGTKTTDAGQIVYDGHAADPTVEGPKFYKRNGYYYIFAPAGGVSTGWQLVLRSKQVYGPYERKVVMNQGTTSINGPHQGAWVNTPSGEDWFIHFQDKGTYGRVVLLQPLVWTKDNWPVIGIDKNKDGTGEPVMTYKKPFFSQTVGISTPGESDLFDSGLLGLQWQWQANPGSTWALANKSSGTLRLYAQAMEDMGSLWEVPSLLLQKMPAEEFLATAKVDVHPQTKSLGDRGGIILLGTDYASLHVVSSEGGLILEFLSSKDKVEVKDRVATLSSGQIFLQLAVRKGGISTFSYSVDGTTFEPIKKEIKAAPGTWVGSKMGLFMTGDKKTNDSGFMDVDWFKVEPLPAASKVKK